MQLIPIKVQIKISEYLKIKNKNPATVALHTSIMCINILQDNKAVPPKL